MPKIQMDDVETLIRKAQAVLNSDSHPLWGPVTSALRETTNEVYRLRAKLREIARTAMMEGD